MKTATMTNSTQSVLLLSVLMDCGQEKEDEEEIRFGPSSLAVVHSGSLVPKIILSPQIPQTRLSSICRTFRESVTYL